MQDAVATSVSTLQQQCQIAIIADPTLAANLNTSVIVLDILSLTCPDNCNGQGACVQGESVEHLDGTHHTQFHLS